MKGHTTLTTREYNALTDQGYNLSDAHPRMLPSPSQLAIIHNLGALFDIVNHSPYQKLVDEFKQAFYSLASQTTALEIQRKMMLCYSASQCIQIAASYLRNKKLKIGLLEPAFDNVVGILKAEKINLTPLPEDELADVEQYLKTNKVDAIWITLPNNPTGKILTKEEIHNLIEMGKKYNVILIIDFCFRFFDKNLFTWDQYAVLEKSGITYITIEDTGKTWNPHDLKVGMLQSSQNIYSDLYYYFDNHLLNVSGLVLKLLTELIVDTKVQGIDKIIYNLLIKNRKIVEDYTKNTILTLQKTEIPMTVAWLKITTDKIDAIQLCQLALQKGLHILPGTNFFWSNPEKGKKYVRISISRNTDQVKKGMEIVKDVIKKIN